VDKPSGAMRNLLILLAAVILFMLAGLYYQLFYPPSVIRRNMEKTLQHISDVVDTQDRAKIAEMFGSLLTDDIKMHIAVEFSAISGANARPMEQDFDKEKFLPFIDNVIYTLTDYHAHPLLEEFALHGDTAHVQFKLTHWADGPSFIEGVTLQMHYSGDTDCDGEVVFEDKQPRFHSLNCHVLLRSVTKGDSAGDMINKAQQLNDMMKQEQQQR
jgi:hypothetical protein